jgi:hypothetical protein
MNKKEQGVLWFSIMVVAACIQIPYIVMAFVGMLQWWHGVISGVLFGLCLWLAFAILKHVVIGRSPTPRAADAASLSSAETLGDNSRRG